MYLEKRFLTLILVFISFSCSDAVELKKEDVVKYDWLSPFVINVKDDFEGTHDIDSGILKFNYNVTNFENIISTLDDIAISKKWEIRKDNDFARTYSKEILIYGDTMKKTTIQITLKSGGKKIYFDIQ